MKLINKSAARKLYFTLDDSEKEKVIYALGENPVNYGELIFDEFYNYLEITLASNTNYDIGIDVVSACDEMAD